MPRAEISHNYLHILNALYTKLEGTFSIEKMGEICESSLAEMLDFDLFIFNIYDADRGHFLPAYSKNTYGFSINQTLPRTAFFREIMQTNEAKVLFFDEHDSLDMPAKTGEEFSAMHSWLVAPVFWEGEGVAVICIASEEIQHFAETDYLYFKICADILRSAFIIATIQGLKTQVETNYLFFYQSSPIGLCILDEMGYMMDCNKASLDILQLSRKKYLHAPFSHLLSDDDQDIFERTLKSLSPEKKTELQIQFQGDGSDSRHLLLHLVKVTATTVFVFMTDVTDKLVLAQEVSDIKADLAKVQEIAQLGDWKLDYQTGEMRWSDALYHLFGLKPQEGTSSFELFEHFIHEGDRRMFNEAVDEAIHRLKTIDTDFRFTRFDGFKRVGHMHATAEQSMETGYIRLLGTIQDITHQKQLEKELERLSFIDGLTGISNRRRFDEAIQREWQRAMRHRNSISLILCDIDHFKLYNDTYGHQSGDECLKKVAARIEKTPSRVVDLTARYGGEEFVILLPDTEKEGAIVVAENIRKNVKALGIPHSASLLTPVVTLSLGVATLIPKRNQDFTDLIKTADKALYIAKQKGRNRVESLWESN